MQQPVLHPVCVSILKTLVTHPGDALDAARAVASDGTGRPVASQCVRTLKLGVWLCWAPRYVKVDVNVNGRWVTAGGLRSDGFTLQWILRRTLWRRTSVHK